MNRQFELKHDDIEIISIFKREANIVLASLKNDKTKQAVTYKAYQDTLHILTELYNVDPFFETNVDFILNSIIKIRKDGLLSELTLNDNEFDDHLQSFKINKRYGAIWKDNKGIIYNSRAYNIYVRAEYDHVNKIQRQRNPELIEESDRIYLSKGGVITGEYIENCIIPKHIVEKHYFTIQSIVNIPVSVIYNDDKYIYCVDHREPKLKILMHFYEVPIYVDDFVKQYKYNIRNYKKIK